PWGPPASQKTCRNRRPHGPAVRGGRTNRQAPGGARGATALPQAPRERPQSHPRCGSSPETSLRGPGVCLTLPFLRFAFGEPEVRAWARAERRLRFLNYIPRKKRGQKLSRTEMRNRTRLVALLVSAISAKRFELFGCRAPGQSRLRQRRAFAERPG